MSEIGKSGRELYLNLRIWNSENLKKIYKTKERAHTTFIWNSFIQSDLQIGKRIENGREVGSAIRHIW